MKTIVKQIAAATFVALFLVTVNVKAEGTKTKASGQVTNMETTLQLEDWMTDETIWNTNSVNIAEFAQETEAKMELENWMTDTELWDGNYNFVAEVEPELGIERWMISDRAWVMNHENHRSYRSHRTHFEIAWKTGNHHS